MAMEAADLRKILSAISKVGSARLSYCTAEYEGTRQREAGKASYLYLRLGSFLDTVMSLELHGFLLNFSQSKQSKQSSPQLVAPSCTHLTRK